MRYFVVLLSICWGVIGASCSNNLDADQKTRPNIILILADDMGYSDLGCYGGEISTPNIDGLAKNGIRFTNFYNAARCCPTRASLLTGLYPHQVGMGGMVQHTDDPQRPAGSYQGYLSRNSVTIAELLKDAGYFTSMSGKWHVGEAKKDWPMNRGFDEYYGLISGAANYFDITKMIRPGIERHFADGMEEHIPKPDGYYMTNDISNHAISTIKDQQQREQPLFMYVAYTAPHWPLHALPEDIEKYKGHYKMGWDSIRTQRYERMKELGIVDESFALAARDSKVPAWEEMGNKALLERKMEVYAAQIDRMDQGIGDIIRELKDVGEYENTIIIFLSDNGACAESGLYGNNWWGNDVMPGGPDSFQSYGRGWANACNTPFRMFKQWAYEGGISTPLVMHWPSHIKQKGGISRSQGYITDIMATLVDVAGAEYPETYKDEKIHPLHGKSLLPLLEGRERIGHENLFWEHVGNMAVIHEKWKLVSQQREGDGSWQLFDLETDRAEQNDLAREYPKLTQELLQKYQEWAKEMNVSYDISNEFSYEKK